MRAEELKIAVEGAVRMSKEVPKIQAILLPKYVMREKVIWQDLRDPLRLVLIASSGTRPSASFVLASKEIRALEKLVSV